MKRLQVVLFGLLMTPVMCVADQFWVSAGKVDITPPVGSYLAGYGKDRRALGRYDNIWVKAILIETASDTVEQNEHVTTRDRLALVTVDNIGLTRPDILNIERAIKSQLNHINLVVSSTHTHAGPDVVGIWGPALWRSGRDENYIQSLIEKTAALITELAATTQPAQSRVASRIVPLDWVENVSEPELLDRQLSVLQFLDEQGHTLATLTNYACHPTVLGPENTRVSADYVYGFYDTMADALDGEHLFLQGSIGGWVQPLQGDRSHALAVTLGQQLGQETLATLAQGRENPAGPIGFRASTVDIPLQNWGFRLLIWLGVLERTLFDGHMRTQVAAFDLGEAKFVTHPGETSPAYSFASRQLMGGEYTFVLGLSQDAIGYILKPEYFADDANYPHGEYLTSVSVGETAGPKVMQSLTQLLTK